MQPSQNTHTLHTHPTIHTLIHTYHPYLSSTLIIHILIHTPSSTHSPSWSPKKSLLGKYHPRTMVTSLVSPGPSSTVPAAAPFTKYPFFGFPNDPEDANSFHSEPTSLFNPKENLAFWWGRKGLTFARKIQSERKGLSYCTERTRWRERKGLTWYKVVEEKRVKLCRTLYAKNTQQKWSTQEGR